MVAMLILFGNFYMQAYIRRPSKGPAASSSSTTAAVENGRALNKMLQQTNGEANGYVKSSSHAKRD